MTILTKAKKNLKSIYATLISKHSDWLFKVFNQPESFKNERKFPLTFHYTIGS